MNKIVFVHPLIRTYRAPLFKLLGENGVDFFFTSHPNNEIVKKEVEDILTDFPYKYINSREVKWLPVEGFSFDLLKLFKYKKIIFSISTSVPFLLMAPLLKLFGKKIYLFEETWRYPLCRKLHYMMRPWIQFIVPKVVDGMILTGKKAQEFVNSEYNYPIEKTKIATNTTVDLMTETWPETAKHSELIRSKQDVVKILYLGRVVKYKGLDLLLEAMTGLENSELFVIGDGPYLEKCKSLASGLDINSKVHFLGSCTVEERKSYFRDADIFVLPSRFDEEDSVSYESWGFTVNEAMAMEKVVVTTTAVGSAFDLIDNDVSGYQVEQGDWQALLEILKELEKSPHKIKQMGRVARQELLKRTNYQQNLNVIMELVK